MAEIVEPYYLCRGEQVIAMSRVRRDGKCPIHGPVEAERESRLDVLGWIVAAVSALQWTPDRPYRCRRGGRTVAARPQELASR